MTDTPTVLLCDCAGTMTPDARAIEAGTGLGCSKVHRMLCRDDAAATAAALQSGPVLIACGQEVEAFADLAEDLGVPGNLATVDIRDRAGWTDDATPGPKMAALIADARLPVPTVPALDITSDGVCLILGAEDVAIPAAQTPVRSSGRHRHDPRGCRSGPAGRRRGDGPGRAGHGRAGRVHDHGGRLRRTLARRAGHPHVFATPRNGAQSACDIIVDLTGGTPLFPAHHKRDGYLRADPRDPLAVERALFDAVQLVGAFEKPLYIRVDETLCAHSRASQTGCTRCLDLCPTSAIAPAGDHIVIDPAVCAGCGACAAACPSGAASADDPPVQHLNSRMRTMAEAFRKAGGTDPRLLVHDDHGAEMIRLAARHGRGLPADVIPMEIPSLGVFGHAEMLAALGVGFSAVTIVPGPRTETDPMDAQIALANAIAGEDRVGTSLVEDPDALSEVLYKTSPSPRNIETILPLGGRRDVTRLAATALRGTPQDPVPLPDGAPYGTIAIDPDACTLCLACVSLCPPGALGDNPDSPEVNFREEACLQCGLCATVCPENAITLVPQLDLRPSALASRTLHQEEPFACIACGKLFGVKSTIEKITEKLAGAHPMFTNSDNAKLIQMCDDCRVKAQFHAEGNPFRMGTPRRVRTTDDYLDET